MLTLTRQSVSVSVPVSLAGAAASEARRAGDSGFEATGRAGPAWRGQALTQTDRLALAALSDRYPEVDMAELRQLAPLSPEAVSRPFLASLFRCLHTAAATLADLVAARERGAQDAAAACTEREQRARFEVEEYTRLLADFAEASGVRIDRWDNGKRIGVAVRTVLAGENGRFLQQLQSLRSAAAAAVVELDRAIAGDQ